jgi:hypothetical protein
MAMNGLSILLCRRLQFGSTPAMEAKLSLLKSEKRSM